MNSSQFDRILRQVFLLPIFALLFAAAAIFWGIQGTNKTVSLIQQADDSIKKTTELQKLIVDQESSLRGFQMTSDTRFLDPFKQSVKPIDRGFDDLHQLLSHDPDAVDDLDTLQNAYTLWINSFANVLVYQLLGGGEVVDADLNLVGKRYMDNIRADVEVIVRDATQRRQASIDRWRRQVRFTLIALLSLAIVTGLTIGFFARDRLKSVSAAYGVSQEILRRRADDLFVSEQNLRTTLSSIGDGVITCGTDNRIQIMNDVAQELTGWSQHEGVGQLLGVVFRILDESTHTPIEDPVSEVRRLNRVVDHGRSTVLIQKDGSELLIDDNAAPIRNKSGEMTGIVMVFRDVTLERKTQSALLANEKLAVAGRLAASIAHEIHNPLDAVSNLLFLMKSGSTPEETHQFLTMAQGELARVTQISRAMLGLYRESKAPVTINLHELLSDVLILMENRFRSLAVHVSENVPPGLEIEGFPAELRQVFTNLITNAAEAASGSSDGTVHISAKSQSESSEAPAPLTGPGAVVTVADNGPGIPPELKEQLFRPFFTTKGEQGTGLGLWVSQGILRKHGGTIQIESSTDRATHGTQISVFLAARPTIEVAAS